MQSNWQVSLLIFLDAIGTYVVILFPQVMQESLMMIPDSHRRLENAYAELKALVDAEEAEMAEAKEFQDAKAVLAEADEQLKAS